MTTMRYLVEIATSDTRDGVQARLADELADAIGYRFEHVVITPAPPGPVYPPGSCEVAP